MSTINHLSTMARPPLVCTTLLVATGQHVSELAEASHCCMADHSWQLSNTMVVCIGTEASHFVHILTPPALISPDVNAIRAWFTAPGI